MENAMTTLLAARSADVARLTNGLKDLMRRQAESPGDACYLIVNAGDAFIQFMPDSQGRTVSFEAVASDFLPKNQRLDPERIAALVALGFQPPEQTGMNFAMDRPLSKEGDYQEVAALGVLVLFEIYRAPLDKALTYDWGSQ
jgi:hypothetical protein